MDPIAQYKYAGNRVDVYENRLEWTPPGGFLAKKELIIFRNIASLEKPPMLACLDVFTNDGKKHRIPVAPGDIAKLKEQIESRL